MKVYIVLKNNKKVDNHQTHLFQIFPLMVSSCCKLVNPLERSLE